VSPFHVERVPTPEQHHHDHYRRDVHDPQRLFAGFRNTLDVFPPEINRNQHRERRGGQVHGQNQRGVHIVQKFIQQTDKIKAGGNSADGPRQDVVKHQGGHGNLRQRTAHRLLDDAVDSATHKHAAALDINRAHRIRQDHNRQNEPWACFPDEMLSDGSRIERGRAHVVQHHGRRAPERHEGQHSCCGNQNSGKSRFLSRAGRLGGLMIRHM